jgi:G-protein coupled receptor 98
MFRPGETTLFFTIAIFNDNVPEVNEDFNVRLSMPSGGARLGEQTSITMTILTNDDAHGVIGFNGDSLSSIVMEVDRELTLNIDRGQGTFGMVLVEWELSGDHSDGEITPTSGQVKL